MRDEQSYLQSLHSILIPSTHWYRIGCSFEKIYTAAFKNFLGSDFCTYSTGSETFISFTLTNVEFRKSRDFFAWILRGSSVGFAWN